MLDLSHYCRLFQRVFPTVEIFSNYFVTLIKKKKLKDELQMREECAPDGTRLQDSSEFYQDLHEKQKCSIRCSHLPLLVHTHACNVHHCPQRSLLDVS